MCIRDRFSNKLLTSNECCVSACTVFTMLTDVEIIAAILLLGKKKKKRRYWVHPLLYKRLSIGKFHIRYNNMINYPEKFFNYYRMSIKTFDELINLIESDIVRKGNRRGLRKPTEQRTSERFSIVM